MVRASQKKKREIKKKKEKSALRARTSARHIKSRNFRNYFARTPQKCVHRDRSRPKWQSATAWPGIFVGHVCSRVHRESCRGIKKRSKEVAQERPAGAGERREREGLKNDPNWGGQEVTTWTRASERSVDRSNGFAIKILRKNCSRACIRKTGSHKAPKRGFADRWSTPKGCPRRGLRKKGTRSR